MRKRHKPHGKHPHHRLTTVSVRAKRTPGRYADGQGLYLVVDPSGAKRWIWRGVIQGKRSDLGLGGMELVPLSTAREKALACRRQARAGGNPRLERQREQRIVPTFKAAALAVHAEHSPTYKNAKHRAQWLSSLEHDVFPVIGDRSIDTITSAHVLTVLSPIWTVKPETARRVKQRMKLVFDWAKANEFCKGDNPTAELTKVLPKLKNGKRHHAALPYQQVPSFIAALRTAETTDPIRLALELTILTATRTSEVLLARWDEVDLNDARVWTIPASRMKAGCEHRVPLSPRACALLKHAKAFADGGPYIFPGRTPGTPLSNMAFLMLLRRLGHDAITTHGFRSSFRDWAAEKTNVPQAVCEAALAHTLRDKTEAAYNRTDLFDRRRELMNAWARFATATPAKVTAIRA